MVCLGSGEDKKGNPLHELLRTLVSDKLSVTEKSNILSSAYGFQMSRKMEKEEHVMCNLSDLIEEKGIQQGMHKGILNTANILKNLGLSDEDILKNISEQYGMQKDDVRKLLQNEQ